MEFVASVKGTITELKDEGVRTWKATSNEGRGKAVDSILLPDAGTSIPATVIGSCEAAGGDDATAVFEDRRTCQEGQYDSWH